MQRSRRAESRFPDAGGRGHAEQGFNLIEMMISTAVLGVLVGGAFGLLFRSQVTFELQQADQDVRQQARVSLDILTIELRMAGYDIGNLPDAITQAGTNVLQFVGDIDDGSAGPPCGAGFETAVDGGAERITYELTAGRLQRSVECWDGAAWSVEYQDQVVAENLLGDQALFRFFDEDGIELVPAGAELSSAQRDEVRSVTIAMRLLDSRDLVDGQQAAFNISGRVGLPNAD